MTSEPLILNGVSLLADLSGALYWPDRSLLIISDLHLEKGSSFAEKGIPLPPYDTAVTLKRLAAICGQYNPQTVMCLGDSFHDTGGPDRMGKADRAALEQLIAAYDWLWITGNHDPELPEDLPGRRIMEETIGALTFRHEASREPVRGEISGHYHPSARVRTRQRYLSGRCFAYDSDRLIMPAFGALTGGLTVHDKAIRAVLGPHFDILFLGPKRIYRFPADRLC
ncbi:ligase-associated DNA damage response endonuclease PdeM [Nisaea nitritireducens]|uniref:ligase-associated DNA damage response endonuclease PdeM n=1 Tax=Nisaea nitritireducens TaxID=568392 RepID=UPI001866A563|nr:ligase-associated DNA damage response endonuclease PdeM [Nisaea nitritireducens]